MRSGGRIQCEWVVGLDANGWSDCVRILNIRIKSEIDGEFVVFRLEFTKNEL